MKWPARAGALSLFLFLSLVMAQWAVAADCVYSIKPTSFSVDYKSTKVSVNVGGASDCKWGPTASASWMKLCVS